MSLTLLLAFFGTGITAAFGNSLLCYDCHDVTNPNNCNSFRSCHSNLETCVMEVHINDYNEYVYTMGCRPHMHCSNDIHLVGKRVIGPELHEPGPGHHLLEPGHHTHGPEPLAPGPGLLEPGPGHQAHGPGSLRCTECCHTSKCNQHLCGAYQPTTTPTPSTTVMSTTTATGTYQPTTTPTPSTTMLSTTAAPVYDPHCRNREEDGFSCASFDMFNLCTDSSSLAYVLAHEKCRQHCGFCTPGAHSSTTSAPVVAHPAGVCANYEQDGFKCTNFDMFQFCTDPSVIAYVVAHEKCRKHCGFCTVGATTTMASTVSRTAITATTSSSLKTGFSTQSTLTAHTLLFTVTGAHSCKDVEEYGFKCSSMDPFDICTTTDPLIVQLRNDKCRKHCGLCK